MKFQTEAHKAEWAHADTCLPDYWSGHHLPHVSILVWNGMTIGMVREAIRSELAQGAVMGNTDEARLLSADMVRPDEEKKANRLTKKVYAAINRIKSNTKKRNLFPDLPKETEEQDESIYAYFVLIEV